MLLHSLTNATTQCAEFLANNRFEWKECSPDTVEIDAASPDFYALLHLASEVFGTYRGEMRPSLHIYLLNVEKIPFEPIKQLWQSIIKNESYFGNYDFQLYAKTKNNCVNLNAYALSH
jgi:hypothetical protein